MPQTRRLIRCVGVLEKKGRSDEGEPSETQEKARGAHRKPLAEVIL